MSTLEIKHRIIDKLLTINSEELLITLSKILDTKKESIIQLTNEQIKMLQMSNDDILNGDIVSQKEIDKQDLEWLR